MRIDFSSGLCNQQFVHFHFDKSGEGYRCSNDCPCGELKGTLGWEGWGAGSGGDQNIVSLLEKVMF